MGEEEDDDLTPKMLEILPLKMVYTALQQGISMDTTTTPINPKNAKKYQVKNRRFKKEAVESLNRAASLFVLYITTIAHNIAKSNKRSTVLERDVMEALRSTMFWEIGQRIESDQIDTPTTRDKTGEDNDEEGEANLDEIFEIVEEVIDVDEDDEQEEDAVNENSLEVDG